MRCWTAREFRNPSLPNLFDTPVHPVPHEVLIQPFARRPEMLSVARVEVIGTVEQPQVGVDPRALDIGVLPKPVDRRRRQAIGSGSVATQAVRPTRKFRL